MATVKLNKVKSNSQLSGGLSSKYWDLIPALKEAFDQAGEGSNSLNIAQAVADGYFSDDVFIILPECLEFLEGSVEVTYAGVNVTGSENLFGYGTNGPVFDETVDPNVVQINLGANGSTLLKFDIKTRYVVIVLKGLTSGAITNFSFVAKR